MGSQRDQYWNERDATQGFAPLKALELHCVTVQGTPSQMGEAMGESLRERVHGLVAGVDDRVRAREVVLLGVKLAPQRLGDHLSQKTFFNQVITRL